jgi:hypothetical protein
MKRARKLSAPRQTVQAKAVYKSMHHRGTEDTEVPSAIDDPVEPASKHLDVEIDQQAKAEVGQFEIGQYLGTVNRQHSTQGFYLNEDRSFYNNVEPISAVQLKSTVLFRQRHLSLETDASQQQLPTKARFVGRLK